MRRHLPVLILTLVLGIAIAAFASANTVHVPQIVPPSQPTDGGFVPHRPGGNALDETFYNENWENGLDGWTTGDASNYPSTWHIDGFNAFGGSGTSWWVGDTTTGSLYHNGYASSKYYVLDSPTMTLPATTPSLLFFHRYKCEMPDTFNGAEGSYDGWDGMNLRISTNGGTSWTIVTAVTPYYDRDSLFSFGWEHWEGEGIPGWCGTSTTWHLETANLSQWAGQNVMLRWAFASDPAYDTHDDATLLGWEIDHIRVYQSGASDTVFTDDCNAIGQWITHTGDHVGGDLWRITTDNTRPVGDRNVLVCNNTGTNQYNTWMLNYIESPLIPTAGHTNGTLIADIWLRPDQPACDDPTVRLCDYWGIDISLDSGRTWCAASNPNCAPGVSNYVFPESFSTWVRFDSVYANTAMDFTDYLGQALKFRLTFRSDSAHATLAYGTRLDDFSLTFLSTLQNDVSCRTLQVRYPTILNQAFRTKAYFLNVGLNQENSVSTWYRVGGPPNHFFGAVDLAPNQQITKDTLITITTTGTYSVQAWSALSNDGNLGNDTATCANIVMQPSNADPEIGYDNRTTQFQFNGIATGHGPLIKFTPRADTVVHGSFNVTGILAQYDLSQVGDLPLNYHVYADNAGVPGTQLYNQQITVLQTETGPNQWKVLDTHDVTALQGLTGTFWIWLEYTTTQVPAYPAVLGDNAQPWTDIHNYSWSGSGAPTVSPYFYQIHATISSAEAVSDNTGVLPTRWSLEQNFPNPFNPTTDIRYSVPRAGHISLKVFNLVGQEVATLVSGQAVPGSYTAHFDASSLPSGVYFYRLESASFTSTHKMLLLK